MPSQDLPQHIAYFYKGEIVLLEGEKHSVLKVRWYRDSFVNQGKRYKHWVYTLKGDYRDYRNEKELKRSLTKLRGLSDGGVYDKLYFKL